MANRTSIKCVSNQLEADDGRFELESLEPRLLLSADPLGTQVSADLGTLQPERDGTAEALDADAMNAFILAFAPSHSGVGDAGSALPAALDLDALSSMSPGDSDSFLADLAGVTDSVLVGKHDDSESTRHEIIFVDTRTPEYESLLADIHQRDSGIRYDIIILDGSSNGIDQISASLNAYQNLDAIHFISHGNADAVQLGSTWLQSGNLGQYAGSIAGWQDALSSEADLLFYGCNLADNEAGKALVEQLSHLTGADVAASDDLTGGAMAGGDWELEHQVGDIETGIVVGEAVQQQWQGVLAAYVSETGSNASAVFDSANAFGQTFVHNSGGGTYDIDYIGIELDRDGVASGSITMTLRDGWDGPILASAIKDASTLNENPGLEIFHIAPVALNDFQYYTIQVEVGPSSGTLNYGYDNTSPYFWGALYQNGTPDFSSDLAFEVGLSNGTPILTANTLDLAQGDVAVIDSTNLAATDVDSADAGLIFNVSNVDGGQFELTTDPGVDVFSFTQGQILSNEVVFVDDGDGNAPAFDINVSDGTNTTTNVAGIITFTNTNNAPSISVPATAFINELHYDNSGIDAGEAVEIMGPAGTDLTGWSLVFYNGADGLAYNTQALAGTIPNQADNFGTLAFMIAPIQNGDSAADGIALVNASSDVVQFISYEGTLTAANGPAAGMTSTDIGVTEDGATLVGDSLQLTGTGSEMSWTAASANTFGAPNTGQNAFAQDTGVEDTDNVYSHAQMLALLGASDPDDADADLTVQITNVVNGTLTLSGGAGGLGTTFRFTPDLDFTGPLTFDYQVFDDDLAASAVGNGVITIAPVNDNPTGSGSLTTTSVNDNAGSVSLFGGLTVADVDTGENDLVLRITLSDPTAGTITGGGFIDQGGGVYTASGLTQAQANTALDDVQFKPVDNSGSTGSFATDITVDVDDQGGAGYQPVLSATTLTIDRVNDAPTATNLSSTASYNEGDASVAIADVVVSDVDSGETITATLTLANAATGSLSANDGATYDGGSGVWTITGTVASVNTALANLVFMPNANNDVDTSISVVIDDGDEDASGPLTGTITLDVTPVNDLPTSADNSVSTVENMAISFAASDFVFSDVETSSIFAVRIESLPGNGVLTNGAVILNPGDVVPAADLGNLSYTPNTNYNGPDSFTFSVSDGTDYSAAPNTMNITVNAVNTVPTSMDTGASTNEDVARTFSAGDFPFADVEAPGIVALRIDSLPTNGVLMNGATAINAGDVVLAADLGNLSFTPTANFNGTDSFAFSVFDGIDYSAAPSTMTITVNAINDLPTSGDVSISTVEGLVSTFSASDFPFADVETTGLVALRIDSIPANGVLMNGAMVLNVGDVVLAADLANLSYTPNAGFNGSDNFSFSVSDGASYSAAPSTVTASVNPAAIVAPVYEPPAEPLVVTPPEVPLTGSVADPELAEAPVDEAETATNDAPEDETTAPDEPAQAGTEPAIAIDAVGADITRVAEPPPDYDSIQRNNLEPAAKVSLQGLLQTIQIQLPGWDNLLQPGEMLDPMGLLESNDFNRDMDQLREEAAEDVVSQKMTAGTGVVLTTSLTVGYVAYLVRGGVLLSSVLSTLPVWSFIDPTPILASVKGDDDDEETDADDSLESLVAQSEQLPEAEDGESSSEAEV